MDCSEFLARSSEWLDGRMSHEEHEAMEFHASQCPVCQRYRGTLASGLEMLRTLPSLEVPADFHPRLTHRIYHLEDGASIARESLGSGATTVAIMAVAALLAFVAWSPRVGSPGAAVELPAIVVAPPPAPTFTPTPRRPTFSRAPSVFTSVDFQDGLWGDTHQTLFEYSSLSERRRGSSLSRAGLQ